MSVPFAEVSAAFPWFFPVVAFMFGACVGSFLNVVIYRVPKEESIVTPGSHCGCGQPIRRRRSRSASACGWRGFSSPAPPASRRASR